MLDFLPFLLELSPGNVESEFSVSISYFLLTRQGKLTVIDTGCPTISEGHIWLFLKPGILRTNNQNCSSNLGLLAWPAEYCHSLNSTSTQVESDKVINWTTPGGGGGAPPHTH
jgi:hypothetical protein